MANVIIIIPGGSGFVGANLSSFFRESGYFVFDVSRSAPAFDYNRPGPAISVHDLHAVRDKYPLSTIFCVNSSAKSPNEKLIDQYSSFPEYVQSNVTEHIALLKTLAQINCKRLIHLSSISVYGLSQSKIIDETTPVSDNLDIYGLSKIFSEIANVSQNSTPTVNLRLPGVLGVNARSVWLTNLIRKLIQHEPLELFNRQGFFNNAVWVDDLARFCIHLLFSPDSKRHQTFVLAAGSSLTIEEIFTYVKTTVMSTSVAQWKENVAGGFSIDCSSAISAGYKPVSLEEMLSLQIAIERNLSSA